MFVVVIFLIAVLVLGASTLLASFYAASVFFVDAPPTGHSCLVPDLYSAPYFSDPRLDRI